MDVVTSPVAPAAVQHWQEGQMHALEAVRLPFAWKIALFLVIGGAWVFLSTYLKQVATGRWHAEDFREGTVEVLICVAILLYLRALKRSSVKALVELRPVVPVPEEQYERLAQQMLVPQRWVEVLLLAISAALFVFLFVLQPDELPILPRRTVLDWLALGFLSAFACLAIWIVLTLVYCGLRSSLALRALAQSPLIVNAFDTAALLPFGRLGALRSLAFVGVALIPMAILGPPRSGGGYAMLLLSLLSLSVLFVPLWGTHRQIVRARERVLDAVASELMVVQNRFLGDARDDPAEQKMLCEQAERLAGLRRCVLSGPSWPFRDYGAVAWIVTALFLPALVTLTSLFVERILFPIIARAP